MSLTKDIFMEDVPQPEEKKKVQDLRPRCNYIDPRDGKQCPKTAWMSYRLAWISYRINRKGEIVERTHPTILKCLKVDGQRCVHRCRDHESDFYAPRNGRWEETGIGESKTR